MPEEVGLGDMVGIMGITGGLGFLRLIAQRIGSRHGSGWSMEKLIKGSMSRLLWREGRLFSITYRATWMLLFIYYFLGMSIGGSREYALCGLLDLLPFQAGCGWKRASVFFFPLLVGKITAFFVFYTST